MNRMWVISLAMLCISLALAQSGWSQNAQPSASPAPYQPAVPAPSTVNAYGGWPGVSGGTTPAGSAMNGMASVISAKGDYNLSTSAAAINMTQAQRNEIENRQMATNAYFDMRATNRAAREAEAGPRPTMQQIAEMSKWGAPRALSSSQMDPVSGKLDWPVALQDDRYADQRAVIDQLMAKRAQYGALGLSDQTKAGQTVDAMFAELKTQIADIPPARYTESRSFLRSLTFLTSKSELN